MMFSEVWDIKKEIGEQHYQEKCKKDGVFKIPIIDCLGRKQMTNIIDNKNISILITYSKNKTEKYKKSFRKWLIKEGIINEICVELSRKEIEFLTALEEALIPFRINGVRQYSILNYRIDYYIPSLNIAIEYDENCHKNYSYENQELRQKKIEDKLECKFIRVSDKNSDAYNIGFVINEILKQYKISLQ